MSKSALEAIAALEPAELSGSLHAVEGLIGRPDGCEMGALEDGRQVFARFVDLRGNGDRTVGVVGGFVSLGDLAEIRAAAAHLMTEPTADCGGGCQRALEVLEDSGLWASASGLTALWRGSAGQLRRHDGVLYAPVREIRAGRADWRQVWRLGTVETAHGGRSAVRWGFEYEPNLPKAFDVPLASLENTLHGAEAQLLEALDPAVIVDAQERQAARSQGSEAAHQLSRAEYMAYRALSGAHPELRRSRAAMTALAVEAMLEDAEIRAVVLEVLGAGAAQR